MDKENLLCKLEQIEEHARLTLEEPNTLMKERLRMIIALVAYLKTEVGLLQH